MESVALIVLGSAVTNLVYGFVFDEPFYMKVAVGLALIALGATYT